MRRILRTLALQINALHQPGGFPSGSTVATDVGLTQTVRF
jgi:hypothetical protein